MAETVAATDAIELTTPLGPGALRFHKLEGAEQLGRLFEYEVLALSRSNDINPDKVLGRPLTVTLETQVSGKPRHFNGYACRMAQVGMHGADHVYRITMRPWVWFLTRTTDCRIFQNKTVPEILNEIFKKYPQIKSVASGGLQASYRKWEYCVQYRETDFNFVMRLMEQEGIYFYFTHEKEKHTLVLADSKAHHTKTAGYEALEYHPIGQASVQRREHIKAWSYVREVQPVAFATTDFDFKRPGLNLRARKTVVREHDHASYEMFDYPGEYVEKTDGEHYAQARIEEIHSQFELIDSATNARGLAVGKVFTLTKHPRADQNREYLVVSAAYKVQAGGYQAMDAAPGNYSCTFTALKSAQQFRLQRVTHKPQVTGPQTAIVAGGPGDEILTDEYGRVKCQFHWDRHGSTNQDSSCWIRVSQPWAGKNWGAIAIPRVGQEVIVEFLEGDPDQPIITGRVYNADNMPPFPLPAGKVISGVKSQTHQGVGYNELSFDDTAGNEKITIHGQHDMNTTIEHDQTSTVKNNRTERIGVDDSETVGNNQSIHIGASQTIEVVGPQTLSAATIDETAMSTFTVKAGTVATIEAPMIVLKAGPSKIVMTPAGIVMQAVMITQN